MAVIWWIRRDLRLSDTQALAAATATGDEVVPLFILDPVLLDSPYVGAKRLGFLFAGLRELDNSLKARGSGLVIRKGRAVTQLQAIMAEVGATVAFAEADGSPYARRRDEAAGRTISLTLAPGLTAHPPGAVLKGDGTPYTVYTPFNRRWRELPAVTGAMLLPAPERIRTPAGIASLPIPTAPTLPESAPFVPGEAEAQRRLAAFTTGEDAPIYRYADLRDRMDLDGTSMLSPYLRFGMLSARQAVAAAQYGIDSASTRETRRGGAEVWLNELIWREFYMAVLYHFPHVLQRSFQPVYDHIEWRNNEGQFQAWCAGRTGYPVVDAAMRQLTQSGWMHNRARMIVASFLVKDLLIDWRRGERWFMAQLIDGDPAANNGGWQWTAGTGTDAAPYFRIFNPVLQGKKFDPDGSFIRSWVPELRQVPVRFIHEPWLMPAGAQREAGCVIGRDYPAPIVDRRETRQTTLDAYASAREKGA